MINYIFIFLLYFINISTGFTSTNIGSNDKVNHAVKILSQVKYAYPDKTLFFRGEIRPRRIGFKMIPLNVSFSSNLIYFEFFKNNKSNEKVDEIIKLSFLDDKHMVQRTFNGETTNLENHQFADQIRGTDITYDDIAMRFLHWPNPILLSTDKAKGGAAWKIRCINPSKKESYSIVDVWVSHRSGTLVKMNAYNSDRKIIKTFEVDSIQQIKGDWFVETMIVRTFPTKSKGKITSSFLKLESKK